MAESEDLSMSSNSTLSSLDRGPLSLGGGSSDSLPQPPSAAKVNFEALRKAMGAKVDLLNYLPFDRVQLIPHTDDVCLGRKTLAPWKLKLGTTKHDESIYAYPMTSIGGTHKHGTLAASVLSFSSDPDFQSHTALSMSQVLQENRNEEYEAVKSSGQLKALIKVYFIYSGVCDVIKIGMSQRLVDDIVGACNSFAQQNTSKVRSRVYDSIERSTLTGLKGSGSSVDHHRSVQLNSETLNQDPVFVPTTTYFRDLPRASSTPMMTDHRASPNTQSSFWLADYKKEVEYPLATARANIRDITVKITTCRAELETLKEDSEKVQAERLRLQKDREKAQADFVKAQADLAKADADLEKTNATLDKDIEGEQNRLYAKIDGFEKDREQAKNEEERVQKLKVEILEYFSATIDDEPAAKRMRRE